MSVVEDAETPWQTTRPCIKERCKFMFNNKLLSDVKFVVRDSQDGESESTKAVIPAHKFLLSISSPVFLDMFYGEKAKTTDTVEMLDCDYGDLLELFRYIYSDEVELSGSNVLNVLYLAHKYMVPSLYDKCIQYLQNNLDASKVFYTLPYAMKFEEEDLENQCWQLIDTETEAAFQSNGFVTLERPVVETVLKRDSLQVKEVELFKAVDRWATDKCKSKGPKEDEPPKRQILGDEIVGAIRFPLMSESEFVSNVLDSYMLKVQETTEMMKHFNNVLTSPLHFSQTPRSPVKEKQQRLKRFQKCFPPKKRMWDYSHCSGKPDGISFYVNKVINLHGVHIYGCKAKDYNIALEVKSVDSSGPLVTKSGSYPSEEYLLDVHWGFDVLFDAPLRLKPGVVYEIEALIDGDRSWFGEEGNKSVRCSGATFTFIETNLYIQNGTDVGTGQFPELIFSSCEM